MQAYIDQIGHFIEANQVWAGPVAFLMTMGESLFIIGIMLPATALLLFTGGLIGAGTVALMPVLVWGIAGAIVGDAISFWVGRWIGPSILRWRFAKQHRTTVARARLFFYRYGFLSIFFGRFLGPLRCTVPTIAGVMGMSPWRFLWANVLSAFIWVPLMLSPGYLAAKSISAAHHANSLTLYVSVGFSVVVGVALAYIFTRKSKLKRPNRRDSRNHSHQDQPPGK